MDARGFPHAKLRYAGSVTMTCPGFYPSRQAAISRLAQAGFRHDPRLNLEVLHPVLGRVRRIFGTLGNVYAARERAEQPDLVERLVEKVEEPANHAVRERLLAGEMAHTPVTKRLVMELLPEIRKAGLHLPWDFRPMNYDLAARLHELHEATPLPFLVFYSRSVRVLSEASVELGRVFSLPVVGTPQGTWESGRRDLLDADVGLILEVNVAMAQ
jgi:hypothetical protein